MKEQIQLMVHEKMVQIKERMDMIGEIYNITPNMIREDAQLQD